MSYEVPDFNAEMNFWKRAGFELKTNKGSARWGGATDAMLNLGISEKGTCPHPFKYVAITYFEKDMDERLARLKGFRGLTNLLRTSWDSRRAPS